ncbi:hypothetical protein B5X24_HaOG214452 [Helicoverpa armigera]|uniref:Uncharacterized protein n=1 Tax=Helicoverpa armigera TaxID=29058 RepID=A0A2W1B2X8_HELAM|nr:hypothetical protein B5X24_HaOG214452 [Helicoverpa armigera]
MFAESNIDGFHAIIRKRVASLMRRVRDSSNSYLRLIAFRTYTPKYWMIGRPPTRWTDDFIKVAGRRWTQVASNRYLWRSKGEAYVQQWTSAG